MNEKELMDWLSRQPNAHIINDRRGSQVKIGETLETGETLLVALRRAARKEHARRLPA